MSVYLLTIFNNKCRVKGKGKGNSPNYNSII